MTFSTMLGLCFVIMVLGAICKAYQDNKLMKDNPEAWKAKKMVEADAKERKRRQMGNAAVNGFKIAQMFFRK